MLNLPPDVTIDSSEAKLDSDLITLKLPDPQDHICSDCGAAGCIVKGSGRWQELRHFPVNKRGIVLRIFKRRFYCPDCGRSFYETPEWAVPRLRMTLPLFHALFDSFTEMDDFTRISKRLRIGESAVRSSFDSIEILHPKELPETMCIDEFHADTGFYLRKRRKWVTDDFNVNVTDWKRRAVIDVLQQKNLAFLSKHFKRHYTKFQRSKVRFFVCDMSGAFLALARECFPDAVICLDNFHIIYRLENVVANVRIHCQNQARDEGRQADYNLLKHLHLTLVTKKCNQDAKWGRHKEERLQRLKSAFDIAPELEEAYEALQHMHDILDSFPFSVQKDELMEWFREYRMTEIKELETVVNTFFTFRAYIFNAWKYKRSNGPCEGLNKKIKDVKRSMYGAHSFENFRKRVLLSCGQLTRDDPQVILHLEKKALR